MKRLSLLFVIIALSLPGLCQSVQEKLDEYLTASSKVHKFNGTALIAKEGNIILNKGYGWRDADKHIAHDSSSVFQIGSITKQFTSAAILKLQERGKLNVQDKLSKYIPDYPSGDKITIQHLLTHTSGVFNYTNNPAFMLKEAMNPITLEALIDLFKNKPLDFEPGTRFRYSNSGYILLGYIIEKVSGRSYEQFIRQLIFNPLEMRHSGFDFKELRDPGRSVGYMLLSADTTIRGGIVDPSVSFAAGAIYSTTGDLYKWHKALYTDKVVKQSSLEEAFTPFKNKYGYGWIIDTLYDKRIVGHGGGIFGFTSNIVRVPADDVCVILLSNGSDQLENITKEILKILYDKR